MRVFSLLLLLFVTFSPAFAGEDYICPMHPHVHGKKGDHCPICGMELAPASSQRGQNQSFPKGAVSISPKYMQALGVRSERVANRDFGQSVHGFGRIIPISRNEFQVSLRHGGWIKDLNASAIGDAFKKGDVLLTFYTPDLVAAQVEYLSGIKGGGFKPEVLEERLRINGMDELAIAEFKRAGVVMDDVPLHAPADGVVTSLSVRKGGYIAEGAPILTLQDFSKVWIETHVQIKDMPLLKVGTPAAVTVAQTGEKYDAAVDYIYPMADMESREGMVRLTLDNSEGKLKTEALVDVMFTANSVARLSVSDQAVMRSGMGAYVFKDLGEGRFLPVMVKTGISSGGYTEITFGLSEGQVVVSSGQFMLDAESNLEGGMANMPGMDMSGGDMKNTPAPANDMKGMDMGSGHGK